MSLNVCDSEEDHFIIPLRELSTGHIHNVECVTDMGLFYSGYMPTYRIFFKDEWEIVSEQRKGGWYVYTAAIVAAGMLGALIALIINILTSR